MSLRKFFVTCALLIAIMVAALVEYFCSPWKMYFTMSFVAIFFIYWGVEFCIDYAFSVKDYPERFKLFAAEKVNKLNIPMSQIERERKKYFAQFKRSIIGERSSQIAKFLICFGAAIAIIVGMVIM